MTDNRPHTEILTVPRRQVLRQRLPLATRREHIEDCVENLANIHLAPTAATLGWRDHRLDQRPFGIRQIARISQTAPLSGAPMFRFPHLGTPSDDSGAAQGITNDSSDSTTFWIGSKLDFVDFTRRSIARR